MAKPIDKIPGITFHVRASRLAHRVGTVTLDATVTDNELWDKVIDKLKELRIYTVADLQTAMVEVLQTDNDELKAKHTQELEAMRQDLERERQAHSFTQQALRHHQQQLQLQGALQVVANGLPGAGPER